MFCNTSSKVIHYCYNIILICFRKWKPNSFVFTVVAQYLKPALHPVPSINLQKYKIYFHKKWISCIHKKLTEGNSSLESGKVALEISFTHTHPKNFQNYFSVNSLLHTIKIICSWGTTFWTGTSTQKIDTGAALFLSALARKLRFLNLSQSFSNANHE